MNAIKQCAIENYTDKYGNPTGGFVEQVAEGAKVFLIRWQDGPLGQKEPNGAFVETVIAAAISRLEFYNSGKFKCRENSLAITKLEEALHWLNARTQDCGVEGTYKE